MVLLALLFVLAHTTAAIETAGLAYLWNSTAQNFAPTALTFTKEATYHHRRHSQKAQKARNGTNASNSQSNQDELVAEFTNSKENGYYVDCAANDFLIISNTFGLDRFKHWKGICVEPNAMYHRGLIQERTCQLFVNPVSDKAGEKVTFNTENAALGGIVREDYDNHAGNKHAKKGTDFETATLTDMLDYAGAPKVIDYLSLDLEGAEYDAMSSFNFTRYTFLVVTVERPKRELHFLLSENGYRFVYVMSTFGECLYLHHTIENFSKYMKKYHRPTKVAQWGPNSPKRVFMKHPAGGPDYHPWTRHNTSLVPASTE